MAKVVVEFSGYMELHDNTLFVRLDDMPGIHLVTAKQWLALDNDEKDEYTIYDMNHAMENSVELSWDHCDTIVEDANGREIYSDRTYS